MEKHFWAFKNKGNKTGELLLYGDIASISWWGDEVTPKQFKEDLDALGDIDILNVYINSDGGDVFAGQAIHSMLKRHKAKVNVHIDGLAASIASVVAMAGDKIYMPSNSMMMVHKAWTWTAGNSDDLRKMADDLEKIEETIVNAYRDKSGLSVKKIKELMEAETWMTAEEAVQYGFADEVEKAKQIAASINKGHLIMNGLDVDLGKFKNASKLILKEPPQRSVLDTYKLKNELNRRLIDEKLIKKGAK